MTDNDRADGEAGSRTVADPPPDAAPAPSESEDPAALKNARDEFRDRLLRVTAEFDNYRKRVERERREHADESVVDLLLDLLPIIDDFDRAMDVPPGESIGAYKKGVELIHAKLGDLLRKRGVRPIEALGTDFNPNHHQAVTYEESPEHREGEVIAELRRGYTIGSRLLRPAMVKVAKA